MSIKTITLAKAKAHLSELTERAAQGESVVITKHGRPVVRFAAIEPERKPVELAELQALTDTMPMAQESAGAFIRRAREAERY